jgi:hypothetical protein
MKTIKITRSILIKGEHNERGSVVKIDENTANLLIADGSAIAVIEKPAQESQEEIKPAKAKK